MVVTRVRIRMHASRKRRDYEASINNNGGKLLKLRVWQEVISHVVF